MQDKEEIEEKIEEIEEIGGFENKKEPTRYGRDLPEWEVNGRVSDF